jgi:hypothetical protein
MSTVRNAWSAADESRSRRDPSGPWSKEAGPQRCTKQWSSWFADFYTIPFGRNLHACSLYTVRVFEMYVNSQVCMYMDVCIHRHTFIFPSLSSYDIHVDIFSNCTSCPQAMSYKHQLPSMHTVAPWKPWQVSPVLCIAALVTNWPCGCCSIQLEPPEKRSTKHTKQGIYRLVEIAFSSDLCSTNLFLLLTFGIRAVGSLSLRCASQLGFVMYKAYKTGDIWWYSPYGWGYSTDNWWHSISKLLIFRI